MTRRDSDRLAERCLAKSDVIIRRQPMGVRRMGPSLNSASIFFAGKRETKKTPSGLQEDGGSLQATANERRRNGGASESALWPENKRRSRHRSATTVAFDFNGFSRVSFSISAPETTVFHR